MARKESIRVRPPAEDDRFGDPVGTPEWAVIPGCTVVPRESHDYQLRGTIIISGFMVRTPPGAVVGDEYEVEVRGEIHQIEGAVADFLSKGKIFYTQAVN